MSSKNNIFLVLINIFMSPMNHIFVKILKFHLLVFVTCICTNEKKAGRLVCVMKVKKTNRFAHIVSRQRRRSENGM